MGDRVGIFVVSPTFEFVLGEIVGGLVLVEENPPVPDPGGEIVGGEVTIGDGVNPLAAHPLPTQIKLGG